MLETFFGVRRARSDWIREVTGGVTTFLTMAYIIFVQPAVLGAAGMDPGAVLAATCLASAVATLAMGILANYPIALAPGMGLNFFFAYTVVLGLGYAWQQALGAVFLSGCGFLALGALGLREKVLDAVPASLKSAIPVGIGFLISLVGLQWSGLIVDSPGTLVRLGNLGSPAALLSLAGIALISILLALGIRGAVLWGILATLAGALATGQVEFQGITGPVPSLAPTWFQLDIAGALSQGMLTIIFVFFFLDLFDTAGTLIGVSGQAGLLDERGRLPRVGRAMTADAVGTLVGSLLGTSTVTSYVESSSGISAGARTGLASVVTALLFLSALFFTPIVRMVGGGLPQEDGTILYPVIAPALVLVGCYMIRNVARVPWDDYRESIPAFLTILLMPLSFSITEGLSFGFISYAILHLAGSRRRKVPVLTWVVSLLFVLRYVFLSG